MNVSGSDDSWIVLTFNFLSKFFGNRGASYIIIGIPLTIVVILCMGFLLYLLTWFYMRRLKVNLDTYGDEFTSKINTRFKYRIYNYYQHWARTFALMMFWVMTGILFVIVSYIWRVGLWFVGQWWFIPIAIVVSWGFFVLRTEARYAYGLIEIAVGLAALFASFISSSSPDVVHLIAVLGAIYIIIRGLDNFEQGLPSLKGKIPSKRYMDILLWWELLFKKPTLDAFTKNIGFTPNMMATFAQSPIAFNSWATLLGSLSKALDVKTRDSIGLAVSEVNGCN